MKPLKQLCIPRDNVFDTKATPVVANHGLVHGESLLKQAAR